MSKIATFFAALAAIFVMSLAGPADAAPRKADGIKNTQATEISAQRRRYAPRRYYRPRAYYRPYYRPYYGYRYYRPYRYGWGYPYYGPGVSFGAPGFGFSFRL